MGGVEAKTYACGQKVHGSFINPKRSMYTW